jgi:N-methylhydantoinase A
LLKIAVDVGGTFTDLVAAEYDGRLFTEKVRSTPKAPEEGFLSAISLLLSENNLPPAAVSGIVHVGTIGTNLFLGQIGLKLPKVALISTVGFRDVIEIGRQNRPELYNIFFQRPKPLVPRRFRFEVSERVDSSGRVTETPSQADLDNLAKKLSEDRIESVAISFLNSYANPLNEQEAREILSEKLRTPIFASSDVDPEHREYERTSTTVVNAVLAPVVSTYLKSAMDRMKAAGITSNMQILSSAGGLVDVEEARSRPVVTIESGPAAGVVGAAEIAKLLGIERAISLDMGGTSAKAGCGVDYVSLLVPEIEVGGKIHMGRSVKGSGYPVRSPSIDLAEVSAGGGTIIWANQTGALQVGPISSGADPGPACYAAGGQDATITDANLVLGRIGTELLHGKLKLNLSAAENALQQVADRTGLSSLEVATASLRLANLHMAKAVYVVSLERGQDPRDFTLLAFGGAGPMHAAELADEVGIATVVIPPWPGLFSALSMLLADVKYTYVTGMLTSLDKTTESKIEESFNSITHDALEELDKRGIDTNEASITRTIDLRYLGQGYELEIEAPEPFDFQVTGKRFEAKHEAVYGYKHHEGKLEVTAIRLTLILPARKAKLDSSPRSDIEFQDAPAHHRRTWFDGDWHKTPVYSRELLRQGRPVDGPAIVEEYDSTIVVPPRWNCASTNAGCLILRRVGD